MGQGTGFSPLGGEWPACRAAHRPLEEPAVTGAPLEAARSLDAAREFESPLLRVRAAVHLVGGACLISRMWRVRSSRGAPRRRRPLSSTGERLVHTQKAGGSTPSAGTVTVAQRQSARL